MIYIYNYIIDDSMKVMRRYLKLYIHFLWSLEANKYLSTTYCC